MPKVAKFCDEWQKWFDMVAYGCFLLLSYALVKEVYEEFQEGKSAYQVGKLPLTSADYPAIVFKFTRFPPGLKYGHDFTIQSWVTVDGYWKAGQVVFRDRRNPFDASQSVDKDKDYIEITLLAQSNSAQYFGPDPNAYFFLVSLQNMKHFESEVIVPTIALDFTFLDPKVVTNGQVHVHISSMANSYSSAASDNLSDGFRWIRYETTSVPVLHNIGVAESVETNHLPPNCMDTSFYECLEYHLANSKECGGVCEYVSFPNNLLPICNSTEQILCSKDIFERTVMDNDHKCGTRKQRQQFHYSWKAFIVPPSH